MDNRTKYDIAIIGAGSGGLSIAAVTAPLGLKTILIEAHKMGGECLNTGCVPSKSLLAAAKAAHHSKTLDRFGIHPASTDINFNSVMESVNDVIKRIAPHDSVKRFTALGVEVLSGHATFIDTNTIQVGQTYITARKFIIATGSSPAIPPIPGLNQTPFLTNETIFDLREKPEHLLIIGGGPIGCELAQAFLWLGVKVTLLEALTILPHDDADLTAILREQLCLSGLNLHEQINISQVEFKDKHFNLTFKKNGTSHVLTGSHLLVATGRIANVQNLGLDKANVVFTPKGIQVNKHLQTANSSIYAIGDVVGPYQFTHMANYQAGIVIKHAIFKIPASVDYRTISWVTYTSPELAHVGLTMQQALQKYPKAQMIEADLSDNDRAQTERETIGKIKVIITPKGKILGVSILAPLAGELIAPWIIAIQSKKSLRYFTDIVLSYPTFSEISKRVASLYYAPFLFSRVTKRLVQWLKYF
jgi:pyruvate/2-oxoglutarate dehydrogenase complex dihydrolipoamide dehydrogenase (E3) component